MLLQVVTLEGQSVDFNVAATVGFLPMKDALAQFPK
jgi:hypothetical protein